jgi:hypothetical protein
MPSVVFLRAVNVGKANRCRPAEIARIRKLGSMHSRYTA